MVVWLSIPHLQLLCSPWSGWQHPRCTLSRPRDRLTAVHCTQKKGSATSRVSEGRKNRSIYYSLVFSSLWNLLLNILDCYILDVHVVSIAKTGSRIISNVLESTNSFLVWWSTHGFTIWNDATGRTPEMQLVTFHIVFFPGKIVKGIRTWRPLKINWLVIITPTVGSWNDYVWRFLPPTCDG